MATFLAFIWILLAGSFNQCKGQCYEDSDIFLTHNKPGSPHYQEGTRDRPQCIGNYSVISETTMDGNKGDSSKGIKCSRKDSTSTNGYWRNNTNGVIVDCDNYNSEVNAYCERGSGYVTLYTPEDQDGYTNPPTNFTCCIEGLCATIRVYNYDDFDTFQTQSTGQDANTAIAGLAQLETCIIVPPSDITAIPQQYLVQMNTSVIPFSRISSLINCTNGDGITCGQSYYTLIDLNEERYQMTVPVTWSTDSTTNTDHYYSCRVRVGGRNDEHKDGHVENSKNKFTSIKASSAPSSVSYEVLNATAINLLWSISGDVHGFIINITSDGLDIVTIQLTDGSLREYVINGLLPDRGYTVEVRGYYELLGPAKTTTTVRLYATSIIHAKLLSVSDDLNTQVIKVNCTTFRVTPDQVTWIIDSNTPDSSYLNGSVLLDSTYQTYRHYITLTGSFTDGTTISCNASVNGESISKDYTLRAPSSPPTGLSATILSSTSLSISWTPLSDVNGYIIQYTGGQPVVVDGENSSNSVLEGLTQGTTYQINIYSYSDLLSTTFTGIHIVTPLFGTTLDIPLSDIPSSLYYQPTTLTQSTSDSTNTDTITDTITNTITNPATTDTHPVSTTSFSTSSSIISYSIITVTSTFRCTSLSFNKAIIHPPSFTTTSLSNSCSTSSLFTTPTCTSSPFSTDSNTVVGSSSNGLVIGIITMGIIIVILIVIIVIQTVFIWRRIRSRNGAKEPRQNNKNESKIETIDDQLPVYDEIVRPSFTGNTIIMNNCEPYALTKLNDNTIEPVYETKF